MSDTQTPQVLSSPGDPNRQAAHCPHCGAKNLRMFNFCQSCGKPLPWAALQVPQPVTESMPSAPPAVAVTNLQQPKDEPAGLALILISFFLPFIGLIIWIALLVGMQRKKAAHVGLAVLASCIVTIISFAALSPQSPLRSQEALSSTPEAVTMTPTSQPETQSADDVPTAPTPRNTPPASSDNDNTPIDSVPTRIDSKARLDGERFPQTRMREMSDDEISQMTTDDIRYAINEMYARYGMTFKHKNYQENFNALKWYRPNDKWKPNQIEKAFDPTERKNLGLLTSERDNRHTDG